MNKRVKKSIRTVWLHVVVAFLSLAFAFPLLWMLMTSFKTPREYYSMPPKFLPNQFVLFHYKEAFAPGPSIPTSCPRPPTTSRSPPAVESWCPTSSTA